MYFIFKIQYGIKYWFSSPLWKLSKKKPNSNYKKITEKYFFKSVKIQDIPPCFPNCSRSATKKAAVFQVHLKDNYNCLASLILLQKYFTKNF